MGGWPIFVIPKEHHAVASKLKGKQLESWSMINGERRWLTWKRRTDASLECS